MKIFEILSAMKLLGPGHLLAMKKGHENFLPMTRGLVFCQLVWALEETGVIKYLTGRKAAKIAEIAHATETEQEVLATIFDYLEALRFLRKNGEAYTFDRLGREYMEIGRGMLFLARGYQPFLSETVGLLRGTRVACRDVARREDFVAVGSGMLGEIFPFRIMWDIAAGRGYRNVLDIGCGDGRFMIGLFKKHRIGGSGIDVSTDAVRVAEKNVAAANLAKQVEIRRADMFAIGTYADLIERADCIALDDVLHEYFLDEADRISKWLADIRHESKGKPLLVAEFCRQSQAALRNDPTAAAEHHVFHDVSRQRILTERELEDLFAAAGYKVIEKRVYNMVGHGYFLIG